MSCEYCQDSGHRPTKNFGTGEIHRIKCHCKFELPIPMVIQPKRMDCGLAALAMVSEKPFEEVRVMFDLSHDWQTNGMNHAEFRDMLEHLGFSFQMRSRWLYRLGGTERDAWPGSPFAPIHIALVQNLPNTGGHYVVWLPDGRVMDPWWGVMPGLDNYTHVDNIYGLWRVPT